MDITIIASKLTHELDITYLSQHLKFSSSRVIFKLPLGIQVQWLHLL